jgi:hypothetical protein
VQEVLYNFPTAVVSWTGREVNRLRDEYLVFHGTKASLSIMRNGYQILPETWRKKEQPEVEAKNVKAVSNDSTPLHVRNFLDCVKSRQHPIADVEEGHLTAVMCHLGNIATRLGRSLQWDAAKEQFVGDQAANGMLRRAYRKPWSL